MDHTGGAVTGLMHDAGAKAPAKRVHTMVVTRKPTGHHVTHHHTHAAHPAESYMVEAPGGNPGNLDNLMDHMQEHMGDQNPGEQECEDGQCE